MKTKIMKPTKKQLAKLLIKGCRAKKLDTEYLCYFDGSEPEPFRYDSISMGGIWSYADGETEWEITFPEKEPKMTKFKNRSIFLIRLNHD